jgi:four helix bundle protein
MMRDFEELIVWQKARVMCRDVHRVSSSGQFGKHFGLRDQICRASISVMSNVAEGFGRYSRADFRRFIMIARASVAEVRSQLYVAFDLDFIDDQTRRTLSGQCVEIDRLLAGLWASLKGAPLKSPAAAPMANRSP